ncbi:hypothetical protein LEP1GSC062_0576 [Leptospira alexanderi serovar Manhao 3 str. L 60]|uniref:Uncharacterized protein n=1 Tax=Leptospira alexanderi serovar Manhao 3 str. L 60 TaxID=1049759 RepID=V6I3F1_9LEPT|nr:hypothetical protein LEP1GSC062_0576 [Leptospira alexanderi serovar Manhao 3 str. L 60]
MCGAGVRVCGANLERSEETKLSDVPRNLNKVNQINQDAFQFFQI